jgi:hypothetical protein
VSGRAIPHSRGRPRFFILLKVSDKWVCMPVPRGGAFQLAFPLIVVLTSCKVGNLLDPGSLEYREVMISLTGTVTAVSDGRPLADATVVGGFGVLNPLPVVTDSMGHYALTALTDCYVLSGGCEVRTSFTAHLDGFERGFEPRRRDLWMQAPESTASATLDFALRPTRPIWLAVQGQVTEGSGGAPIEGVEVTATEGLVNLVLLGLPEAAESQATDTLGMYRIEMADFCAIEASACLVSVAVTAWDGSRFEARTFNDLEVPGDSLVLVVDFHDLR